MLYLSHTSVFNILYFAALQELRPTSPLPPSWRPQEGRVLCEVFAVGLDSVLHDGQQSSDKACYTRTAANVLHRSVHVIRAGETQGQKWPKPQV